MQQTKDILKSSQQDSLGYKAVKINFIYIYLIFLTLLVFKIKINQN